jgi:hypothetical protein
VISHNKLEVKRCLILFLIKDSRNGKRTLVSGTHEGFRSTSWISLNNLNTEEKKSCRSAVKICF